MSEAAQDRADCVRAPTEERPAYEVAGKTDRIAQDDAELARFGAAPVKRVAPKKAKPADV